MSSTNDRKKCSAFVASVILEEFQDIDVNFVTDCLNAVSGSESCKEYVSELPKEQLYKLSLVSSLRVAALDEAKEAYAKLRSIRKPGENTKRIQGSKVECR